MRTVVSWCLILGLASAVSANASVPSASRSAQSAYSASPDWVLMYNRSRRDLPTVTWYFNRKSELRNGPILTVWVLMDFRRAQFHTRTYYYHHYLSVESLDYVDCARHRIATAEDIEYSKPMAKGEAHTYAYVPDPLNPHSKSLRWEDPQIDRSVDRQSSLLCRGTGITYVPVPDAPAPDRLTVPGTVTQMVVAPAKPGTLVVAVAPDTIPRKFGSSGVYTFSLKDPYRPQMLGFFPLLDPTEIRLSPDGQMAYVLVPPRAGYPKGRQYYGIFILDLANPAKPRLLAHLAGLFWTMGLAPHAGILFVQNFHSWWADGSTAPSRIRAYRLEEGLPTTYCNVDLGTFLPDALPFAYGFLHFIGSHYLGINSRGHQLFVMDTANPCRPHILSTIVEQYRSFLVGWKNGQVLLIDGHDITSLAYATPRKTILLFRPPPGNIGFYDLRVQGDGAIVTGLGANEVSVFEAGKSDCFYTVRSFHLFHATTEPVVRRSTVYAGGKDFVTVMRLAAGKTLAADGALACKRT